MTIVDFLKKHIEESKVFDELKKINVDFTGQQKDDYSINMEPELIELVDVTGELYYAEYNFSITTKKYTSSTLKRIENLNLLEKIRTWIRNNPLKNNELLDNGLLATKIELPTYGYLFENDTKNSEGVYQIKGKLICEI